MEHDPFPRPQLPQFEPSGGSEHTIGDCSEKVAAHLSGCETCAWMWYRGLRDLMSSKGWL